MSIKNTSNVSPVIKSAPSGATGPAGPTGSVGPGSSFYGGSGAAGIYSPTHKPTVKVCSSVKSFEAIIKFEFILLSDNSMEIIPYNIFDFTVIDDSPIISPSTSATRLPYNYRRLRVTIDDDDKISYVDNWSGQNIEVNPLLTDEVKRIFKSTSFV